MNNQLRRQRKGLLHNHNKKVRKQERDLCCFENNSTECAHLMSLAQDNGTFIK